MSKPNFNQERLDLFWHFITERQQIYDKRYQQKLPPPWTKDETLRKHRFTNIYRELDPGTQYVINDIINSDLILQDKIFNILIYRLIGRDTTMQKMGLQQSETWQPQTFEQQLRTLKQQGQTIFTAAYMVSAYNHMGGKDKISNVTKIFTLLHENLPEITATIQNAKHPKEIYQTIQNQEGYGNFLAYQCLVDMLYPDKNDNTMIPFTHNDWVAAGPGAQRGINMILNEKTMKYNEVITWMVENQERELQRLKLQFPWQYDKQGQKKLLTKANIQNCFCEYHKYIKINNGTGRARQRFTGEKRYQQNP